MTTQNDIKLDWLSRDSHRPLTLITTFVPIAKLNFVRVQFLSVAINCDWLLQQLLMKNAFLNGDQEEEVYMDPVPGFCEKFGSKV